MAAEGGSHAIAREIYTELYNQTDDKGVRDLMVRRLMQVDSFEERDAIREALARFRSRNGRCASSWHEALIELREARLPDGKSLRLKSEGAPLDPADMPYVLSKDGCDVSLDLGSKVPFK